MHSILEIEDLVSGLDEADRELFNRLFSFTLETGELKVPSDMEDWVEDTFGSVGNVEDQRVVKVRNEFTYESSLFNELRAKRPMVGAEHDLSSDIEESEGGPFCSPGSMTPEDVFGRVKGEHGVTASNVAKYDKWHGLVVFDEHNPLEFSRESVVDNLETAREWWSEAREEDEDARFPFLAWQCLWKSGASIIHGHMQLLLSTDSHYGNVERLNHVRQDYIANYGTSYFSDLFRVHKALGLGLEKDGVKVMAHLTPKKEKEVVIISEDFDENFGEALYEVVSCLRDDLGVESFTVGVALPPLTQEKGWEGFPVLARVIDRGSLDQRNNDMGAMEVFGGSSVVASDPFKVFENLKAKF